MLLSCLIVVILGEAEVGGSEKVFELGYKSKRIELFNLEPSILVRHTFWSQVLGTPWPWSGYNIYISSFIYSNGP